MEKVPMMSTLSRKRKISQISTWKLVKMPRISIIVHSPSRGSAKITFRPSDTILLAKNLVLSKLENHHDVDDDDVYMTYNDKVLNDHLTLLDYGITQPDTNLTLFSPLNWFKPERKKMPMIPIRVHSASRDSSYDIQVRPTATILYVKYVVLNNKDPDVGDEDILSERVFYKGKELDDDKVLLDYNITEPDANLYLSSLHPLAPKMPKISIRLHSESRGTKTIQVQPTATIYLVKHLASVLFEDSDVLFERVFHKDEELGDHETLLDHGITQPGAYLVLESLYPSGGFRGERRGL